MKSFSQFTKQKFAWGDGDLEHHSSNLKEEAPQDFTNASLEKKADLSQFEEHGKSLSKETLGHVRKYKIHSDTVNKALRNDKVLSKIHHVGSLASKPMVDHLDKATDHKLTKPLTVYRGGQGKNGAGSKTMKKVGHEFTDHGYTSTTYDHNTAHDFSGTRHIFAIHLKPGDKAHHLDMHHNANGHEGEVLLHRGTRFRVIGHTKHSGTDFGASHVTHLEVVHQQPREVKTR